MGCESNVLSELVYKEEVEFDADIAGLGVLIAFVATSLAVIIVLAFAFFTLSVPSRLLNTGDAVMTSGMRRLYRRLRGWFPKLKRVKVVDTRNERVAAYKAFLLATSDQLLVSQVAVLIAALIIHSEITIYSVNIVAALGCLASTVYLGCFPFYMDRLVDHSAAKFLRVLALVSGSGILIFMLIIQLSYSWDMEKYVYFTCAMQELSMDGETFATYYIDLFVPLTVLYGTYETVKLLYFTQKPRDVESANRYTQAHNGVSPPSRISHVTHAMTGILIEMHTMSPIPGRLQQCIDTNSTDGLSTIEKEALYIHIRLRRNSADNLESIYRQLRLELFDRKSKRLTLKEIWQKVKEKNRNTLVNEWLQLKALSLLVPETKSQSHLGLRNILTAERWAFHQCRGSFVWRLFWLWSGNVYGIASIFTYRATTTGMSGDPDHWGFGQVVPLALLALPLFAAMESHADYKRQVKSIMENRIRSTSVDATTTSSRHSNTNQRRAEDTVSAHDLEAIHFIKQKLQRKAQVSGYPHHYHWVTGVSLDKTSSLQKAAGFHAIVMFAFTTLMGLSMALGTASMNMAMGILLLIFTVQRVLDLIFLACKTRSMPEILRKLGTDISNELLQVGDQASRMVMAQGTAETSQDVQDEMDR